MADIYAPEFTNEAAAIAHLEKSRWAVSGANCPKCGSFAVRKMEGATQAGYWLCNDCRDKFTCRTGTVMERSHIPVHKWLLAIHLMSASKKGISAHQMHRMLGITYKSAWFLCHRIREAMSETKGPKNPMGGSGKVVEADETYYGQKADKPKVTTSGRPFIHKGKAAHKIAIVSLVERRGQLNLERIKTYVRHLSLMTHLRIGGVAAYPSSNSIKWEVIDIDRIDMRPHDSEAGLKIADAIASGLARAIEWSPSYNTEHRYIRAMKDRFYRHNGRCTSYGLKIMSNGVPLREGNQPRQRFHWLHHFK